MDKKDGMLDDKNGNFTPTFRDMVDVGSAAVVAPPPSTGRKVCNIFKKNLLIVLLILALAMGVGLGAALRTVEPRFNYRQLIYLKFPGDMLMNMLQMLILPLIVSSLISGLTSLDTRSSGRMGGLAVAYYLTTTFMAVVVGIVLVVAIKPGARGGTAVRTGQGAIVNTADTFLDLIRNCFPANLIEMTFRKYVTTQVATEDFAADNSTIYKPEIKAKNGMNVLGLVTFSIFFGLMIGRMGEKGRALKELFDSLSEVTMKLVGLVIWYSPIGVLFLVAHKVVEMEDPEKTFQQLTYYFLTVMAGLVAHGFITLPLIYFAIVRKNPLKFILGVGQALVTAIGTSSSSATLPITMKCLEENNGVDPRVTKFVAPVGATINMDGTALYEAVAVIFIGQMQGYDLGIGQIIIISITATTAAIGAAGVPQAGLVTMVIVLTAVGFPIDDVTLILAIDWLLDRFRTMVNVLGDAFGAGIVHHLSLKQLAQMDEAKMITESTELNGGQHINTAFEDHRL